jgi:hypothetical protein
MLAWSIYHAFFYWPETRGNIPNPITPNPYEAKLMNEYFIRAVIVPSCFFLVLLMYEIIFIFWCQTKSGIILLLTSLLVFAYIFLLGLGALAALD